MEYFYYFGIGFIILCVFSIISCIGIINLVEKDKLSKEEIQPMIDLYKSKDNIIKAANRFANINAFLIIMTIVSLNIYF